LSKADAVPKEEIKRKARSLKKASGSVPLVVSAATGEGVPEVLRALAAEIVRLRGESGAAAMPKRAEGWRP
jgi:GTP-binding protein